MLSTPTSNVINELFFMPPHPEATFANREDIQQHLCDWTRSRGFVLSIGRSDNKTKQNHSHSQ